MNAANRASTTQLSVFSTRPPRSGRRLFSDVRARGPQVGERALAQRGGQVADAGAAPGAALRADHPLDHLDVVRAPEREALVDLDQDLGQCVELGVGLGL